MRRNSKHSALVAAGATGAIAGAAAVAASARRRRQGNIVRGVPDLGPVPRGVGIECESADGTGIHAEVFGSEHGPTIVLAPGWTEQISYWGLVTPLLTRRGFRVVAYDLRGQGLSAPASADDYSLARYGEDLEAVLGAACAGRTDVVVAGHSLGAMSIAAWAERHQVDGRICGAALLNTGVEGLLDLHRLYPVGLLPPVLQRRFAVATFLGNPLTMPHASTPVSRAITRYIAFRPGTSDAAVRFYEEMLVACDPHVRSEAGIAMSRMELLHALNRVTVPTVVVAGACDRLTPPIHAHRIARALPQLEGLVILPDTGHMGPLERPAETAQALIDLALRVLPERVELAA